MTINEHRWRTSRMAEAIAERQRRGMSVETSQLIALMLAQQDYLEAIDDLVHEAHAEEIGRG